MGSGGTDDRDRAVRRVLWVVLGLNLVVASTKLAVGWSVGALSLLADGLHSLLDASANVVGLVGIAMASRPPDRGHPYGHRRFETMAAVIIGMLIAGGVVELVHRIADGLAGDRPPPEVTWLAVGAVVLTIGVNLLVSRYEARRGRELRSGVLEADSQHTLSDALAAGAVLAGFAAVAMGLPWADLVAAGVVALFIARTAWRILKTNLADLADEAQLDPVEVHRVAVGVPGVRGAHHIRSRGQRNHVHLDLHIHLDPTLPLDRAHAKTHEVIRALRDAFPAVADVVIHTEPADGREEASPIAPGVG
ncbi:MAG: cation diffusion facilitator family transporter [Myxococcota bacterium]